ncbi:MAG: methyltransferase family protein [Candidatus Saccharimonadales bacterium]
MKALQTLVGLSWVVFWVYWFASAANSKPSVSRGSRKPRLGILLIFLLLALSPINRNINLGHQVGHGRPWLRILGVVLFYTGLAVAIWARRYLGHNWGMPMSTKKDPKLVTSGPYSRVRHPIYTGIILAVIGSFLATTLTWLVAFALISAYFIYAAFQEEKTMLKQFPNAYPAYKARTKMLLPFIF